VLTADQTWERKIRRFYYLFTEYYMHALRATLIILFFAASALRGWAQTQLVLLHGDRVLARYSPGQAFTYKLKKTKGFLVSYIIEVREFSVVTSYDTIPFSKIERIGLTGRNQSFLNHLGYALFIVGVGYFAVDEINSLLVEGYGFDNDPNVWEPALILATSGVILRLIRKKSQRLIYPAKLLAAPPGSPFYRPGDR
jgi:hypothetical protein